MSTHVVLSGSGSRFPAFVGALQHIDACVHPGSVGPRALRSLVGSSGGAAVCLLLALGYSLGFLEALSTRLRYGDLETLDVAGLMTRFGLDTGERLERLLRALVREKLGDPAATFADLRDAGGPDLRVTGTNVTRRRAELFSAATTPDMPLWLAVRISLSVPVAFAAPVWRGDHYTDGALLCSFPVQHLPDLAATDVVYAIDLQYPEEGARPPTDLPSFVLAVAATMFEHINGPCRGVPDDDPRVERLLITTSAARTFRIDSSPSVAAELLSDGRRGARDHFDEPGFVRRWVARVFARVLAAADP